MHCEIKSLCVRHIYLADFSLRRVIGEAGRKFWFLLSDSAEIVTVEALLLALFLLLVV